MTTDWLIDELRRSAPPVGPLPDVADAAAEAGLLDVAYRTLSSPVGELLLAATEAGLVQVAYLDPVQIDGVLARLAERVSPRVLAMSRRLDAAQRELDEYFTGRRRRFELGLDRRLMSAFGRRVLGAAAAIPYGSVSTYAAVAAAAGSPRGARAAGNALGANPLPIVLPCHRVLRAGGDLGGYTGGVERKRTLLAIEQGEAPAA
ncbi:MAG: methylated-DNA-[protein]-cysteine S-methyltransferase [Solirubrobacteraceae bacterium]|jgi:methylated-DNA-[protein]-cysteine S-methyltransferase|nr:methylated-DNA-[protein]-cysteine S-methyltransferase [Solirubrobacteraceae bacterium]